MDLAARVRAWTRNISNANSGNLFSRATRPQELRHKTDAQHISMIILQQIWPADYEEVYTQIENIMTHPGNCMEPFNGFQAMAARGNLYMVFL